MQVIPNTPQIGLNRKFTCLFDCFTRNSILNNDTFYAVERSIMREYSLCVCKLHRRNNDAVSASLGLLGVFIVPQIGLRFQRRFELEADAFAAISLGDGKPVINALNRLAKLNLIPAEKGSPTHPSIRTRVQRIEQLSTRS